VAITDTKVHDLDDAAGRQRIMDEAASLFVAQGFDGTSLRTIANTVGMKAGSLYYHFGSKNSLLEAILRKGIAVMVTAFESAEAHDHPSASARIESHVRAHLGALYENGPYTAAHVTTFRTAPTDVREAIVPIRDSYEAKWTTLLGELVQDGALASDTPVGLARLILFGAMNTSIEWFDPRRGTLDQLAAVISRQFLTGFGTGDAQ